MKTQNTDQRPIPDQLAELQQMTVRELQARYQELFGRPTATHHKLHLIRLIAWRIQELAEGGLSKRAKQRAAELAEDAEVRIRPPKGFDPLGSTEPKPDAVAGDNRLPTVGTVITRTYKGRRLEVTVQQDGFEYDGQRYKSLSAVAKAITGSHCNGFRFFKMEAP